MTTFAQDGKLENVTIQKKLGYSRKTDGSLRALWTYGGFPLEAIMPHMEVEVIFRNLM
jgi:hypothetical protein